LVKAIKALKEGENIDNTELAIKLNLAHAYLLNGDYRAAKSIYKEYQNQNITTSLSWVQKIKDDFVVFKRQGLPSKDFDRVLKLID
jgi:thioredoxin-like negative regulator of GroEL